jgi:hypothetical protein
MMKRILLAATVAVLPLGPALMNPALAEDPAVTPSAPMKCVPKA